MLFVAGENGHRYVAPTAHVLVSEPRSGTWVSITDQVSRKGRDLVDQMENIYAEQTGRSVASIKQWLSRADQWMTAPEAVDCGMANQIKQIFATPMAQSYGPARETIE